MTVTDAIHQTVLNVPPAAWTPVVEPEGEIRDGVGGTVLLAIYARCIVGRRDDCLRRVENLQDLPTLAA